MRPVSLPNPDLSRSDLLRSWEALHSAVQPPAAQPLAMFHSLSILAVTSCPAAQQQIRELAARHGWLLSEASTMREVWGQMHGRAIDVVITDSALPGGDWRDVRTEIQAVAHPPAMVVLALAQGCRPLTASDLDADDVEVVPAPLVAAQLEQAVMAAAPVAWTERLTDPPLRSLAAAR